MSADPIDDEAEADAVFELTRRVRRLRARVLWPAALVSAMTAPPTYLAYRDYQLEAQWAAGAATAVHVPMWTSAVAMLPSVALFALGVLVYRALLGRRLRVWREELCRQHGLRAGQLDAIGSIIH